MTARRRAALSAAALAALAFLGTAAAKWWGQASCVPEWVTEAEALRDAGDAATADRWLRIGAAWARLSVPALAVECGLALGLLLPSTRRRSALAGMLFVGAGATAVTWLHGVEGFRAEWCGCLGHLSPSLGVHLLGSGALLGLLAAARAWTADARMARAARGAGPAATR